jgi:hypothetical protein
MRVLLAFGLGSIKRHVCRLIVPFIEALTTRHSHDQSALFREANTLEATQ